MAEAMEAMTDIMNTVQVKKGGQDIAVKMLHKAQNGGTNGVAKVGYLNSRISVNGHLVSTVTVDPERAPLVRQAFELFATGQYTLDSLLDTISDAGLTARGSNKPIALRPSAPCCNTLTTRASCVTKALTTKAVTSR
jgi:hypothetical protein